MVVTIGFNTKSYIVIMSSRTDETYVENMCTRTALDSSILSFISTHFWVIELIELIVFGCDYVENQLDLEIQHCNMASFMEEIMIND